MSYGYKLDTGEKARCGAIGGAIMGVALGTAAGLYGGYEIGSAINNALEITNTFGRGALDLVVMGITTPPAAGIGFWGGMATGTAAGGLAGIVTDNKRK